MFFTLVPVARRSEYHPCWMWPNTVTRTLVDSPAALLHLWKPVPELVETTPRSMIVPEPVCALGDHADENASPRWRRPLTSRHTSSMSNGCQESGHVSTGGQPGVHAIQPALPITSTSITRSWDSGVPAAGRWPRSTRCRTGHIGAVDVVVDRLWHPTAHSSESQLRRSAYPHRRSGSDVDPLSSKVCMILAQAPPAACRHPPCPASCRPWPAAGHCGRRCAEHGGSPAARESCSEIDHRRAVSGVAGTHHRTDDGVKADSRRLRKNSNPHTPHLAARPPRGEQTQNRTGEGRRMRVRVCSPPNGAVAAGGLISRPYLAAGRRQCRL